MTPGRDGVSLNSPCSAGTDRRFRHCRVRARGVTSVPSRYFLGVNAAAARRTKRHALVVLAALSVAASVAVGGHRAGAQPPPEAGDAVGLLEELVADAGEPVGVSGTNAVDALHASGTTELAAQNAGMEPDELIEELTHDQTMFVTGDAMVGYRDEAPAVDELTGADAPAAVALTAPADVDVFDLSSQPSSGKVLYLDIDGHVTTDGYWNSLEQFQATAEPYVSPLSVSDAQRDAVYEIWRRVAEDYAAFDINVTTRDPGVDGLRKTSAGDQNYGQRMVISPTNWMGRGTLGIALLDVFDEPVDYSAFVFTSGLTPRVIAEAVSHEAGHTLGLRHDGTTSGDEYYDGHGDWAPIMGRSISSAALVTQWSKGEYAFANNPEDDIAEIAAYTGYRPDDHVCTRLIGASSTTEGIIGAGGDVDSFAVDLGVGPAEVVLRPALAAGSNLHAALTVRDAGGTVLTRRPSVVTNWTSSITFDVPSSGRYTIEVGSSDWLTRFTGFGTYGSIGAYILQVSGAAGVAGPPTCGQASGLMSVTPARLLDTRTGHGGARRVPAGGQIALQVTGRGGVPVGAQAAVLSVVAVGSRGPGFLTTFPCTSPRPTASTVNFVAGQVVANTTIATLSGGGQLCIYAHAATDVVVDVTGWIGPAATQRFNSTTPTRVADTRSGLGGVSRLAAGGTIQVDVAAWVPPSASAVALNVTSDAASSAGFVTVFPCAAARPSTSTINFVAGDVRPNNTIVGLGANRRICVYSMSPTDIVVDLTGWFGPTGLSYLPAVPERLLDTREGRGPVGPSSVVAYRPATVALGSAEAVAAAVNVTAVDHPAGGFVSTFDCVTRTNTSTVNAIRGQVNANGAIVPLSRGSDSCLFSQSGGQLVVDLNGWWVR
jgi:hypothetical protein